jgi:hypothetical protein
VFSLKSRSIRACNIVTGKQTSLAVSAIVNLDRGCVTPKVIANVNEYIEGDLDLLEGYENLPEDIQVKVKRALDQGHVDDEEWQGVSFNPSSFTTRRIILLLICLTL